MKSNYKRLGLFIREVSSTNDDLRVTDLRGVNVGKVMMPSKANIIGTDLSRYKIACHHQFVYGPVTSRNGERIAIALVEQEECILSVSYTVFEITDRRTLLPEYLMMWFRRPEFDRYARFMSHGSVREIFGWDELCDVELPVPSPEKQREIVAEYETVVKRIALNEKLGRKLEETAQAIYKHWFVDFEFPMSAEDARKLSKPELEGKPYQSSGGEMVFDEVLKKKIPLHWKSTTLGSICEIGSGKAPEDRIEAEWNSESYPLLGAGGRMGFTSKSLLDQKILVIGRVGTHGVVQRINEPCWPSDNTLIITASSYEFTYHTLGNLNYDEMNRGGVQVLITQTDVKKSPVALPPEIDLEDFESTASPPMKLLSVVRDEITCCHKLLRLILARISTA